MMNLSFKKMTECGWHWGLELHGLTRHRMIETQQPGMQAQSMQRVVTITILCVAADRMPHIGRMDANLILTACLQLKLDK